MRFVPMDCAMSSFSTHLFPRPRGGTAIPRAAYKLILLRRHRIEMPSTFEGRLSPVALAVFVT